MTSSPRLRAFLLALCGVALGIALARLSGGSLAVVLAIVVGVACFIVMQMRRRS